MDPEAAPRSRQGVAVTLALATAALSVVPFLLSLYLGLAQCDESCDASSSDWQRVSGRGSGSSSPCSVVRSSSRASASPCS